MWSINGFSQEQLQINTAQKKLCNCKGTSWSKEKPITIQFAQNQTFSSVNSYGINDEGIKKIINLQCGSSVELAVPGSYQITVPNYICNSPTGLDAQKCPVSYIWTVSGPANGYGTGKPFTFNFSLEGNYLVTVTPVCGKEKCDPCKFTIVIPKPKCDCKGQGWIKDKPVIIQSTINQSSGSTMYGGTYTVAGPGSYVITSPDFICNPQACPPSYVWTVNGPVNGYGTGKPFTFNFSAPGTYTIVITPTCGSERCVPFKFTIVVPKPQCDCKGQGWTGKPVVIQGNAAQPAVNINCSRDGVLSSVGTYQINIPDFICNPASCQTVYSWTVNGPVNGSGTGKPFSFNFSVAGTYTIIIIPVCGAQKCEPCKVVILVK